MFKVRPRGIKSEDTIRVFCLCRMPEFLDVSMIQCNKCDEWYHVPFCVTVLDKYMDLEDEVVV